MQNGQERSAAEPLYLFALLTIILLWLQGERPEPSQPVPARKHIKTAWEASSLFSPTHGVSNTVYFRPDFVTPSETLMSKSSFLMILQPMYAGLNDLRTLRSSISRFYLEKVKTSNVSESYLASHSAKSYHNTAEVISITADGALFKKLNLPGCTGNQTATHGICYIALLRLPMENCRDETRFGCIRTTSGWESGRCPSNEVCDSLSSWTCNADKSSASFDFEEAVKARPDASKAFCNELVSSASLDGIFEYVESRKNNNADKKKASFCLHDEHEESSVVAGKIVSFCANVLYHSIAVDAAHYRVLFLQSVLHHIRDGDTVNKSHKDKSSTTRSGGHEVDHHRSLYTVELDYGRAMMDGQPSNTEAPVASNTTELPDPHKVRKEVPEDINKPNPRSYKSDKPSACIFGVELLRHIDVTECIKLPIPKSVNSLPMYLHFNERSLTVVVFYFNVENRLVLSVLDSGTLQLSYSLRLNDVHSGWFVPLQDSVEGAAMVVGDEYPIGRVLNAIFFASQKYQTVRFAQ